MSHVHAAAGGAARDSHPLTTDARAARAALLLLVLVVIPGVVNGNAHPDTSRVRALNDEASALWYSDPTQAEERAAEALSLARTIGDRQGEAAALRNLGVASDVRGAYAAALTWYEEALDIATSLGDRPTQGAVLNNIGLSNWNLGRLEQATAFYLNAVAILRETGPPARLASVYNNLGLVYSDLKRAEDALTYHQQAYDIRVEMADSLGIGASLHNMAIAHDALGRDSLALHYYMASRAVKEATGDDFGLGATLNNVAGLFRNRGEHATALAHFRAAIEVRARIGDQNGLISSYNNIAAVYNDMGAHDEAIRSANHALNIARASNFPVREYRIYGTLREAYLAKGDYATAFAYTEKFYSLRDSLFSQDRQRRILELQEQYESEKKLREIEAQKRRISEQALTIQQNRVLQAGLGTGLVLLIAFGFLWQSRIRRRELEYRVGRLETERKIRVERERISRDLHDNVGAQLVNLMSGIDLADRYRERDRAEDAERVMSAIKCEAQTIVTQLRDTIWTLQSNEITLDAFARHVEAYVRKAMLMTGLRIAWTTDVDEAALLSPTQALNAFRIIQEAIQNTVKHAGASTSTVRLEMRDGWATLVIADDGTYQAREDEGSTGIGLTSMKRRAEEIGGSFELHTHDGTEVRVRFRTDENPSFGVWPGSGS